MNKFGGSGETGATPDRRNNPRLRAAGSSTGSPRGIFWHEEPRRPEGYDTWTDASGTGSGYGPPSERSPLGFAPPSRIVVVTGYRQRKGIAK